jgi:hypothetical protein
MAGRLTALAALVLGLALAPSATPALPSECTGGSSCAAVTTLRGGGLMPYYRNYPLGTALPEIKRAVIVIHGNGRDVASYFSTMVSTTRSAGLSRETLIIAPYFQDNNNPPPPEGQLAWKDGWKEGSLSVDRGPLVPQHYSFEVVDQFLTTLAVKTLYPNLRDIVVTGNSAGGQFTQRFAATSPWVPPPGLPLRYVVTNPGSYMYLNGYRKIDGRFRGLDEFQRAKCQGWDNYRYGLDKRDGYVGRPSKSEVKAQYRARLVTYLLGENDTGHHDLDDSCEANLQGGNRLVRGKRFFEFMNKYYAPHKHVLQLVPGAGHGAGEVYSKPEARTVLFPPLPVGNRR